MATTIRYSVFGSRGCKAAGGWGSTARGDDYSAEETVAKSLARRAGLRVITVRPDGWVQARDGQCVARHYQITLGRSLGRGQGYTDIAEVMVSIPASQGRQDPTHCAEAALLE